LYQVENVGTFDDVRLFCIVIDENNMHILPSLYALFAMY